MNCTFQITKNRFDGELGMMVLKFDKESLSFASKDKEKPVKKSNQGETEEVTDNTSTVTVQPSSFSEESGENDGEEL